MWLAPDYSVQFLQKVKGKLIGKQQNKVIKKIYSELILGGRNFQLWRDLLSFVETFLYLIYFMNYLLWPQEGSP